MMGQASELYGDSLNKCELKGQRHHCEGCHLASNIKRNQGLHLGKLIGRVTAPGESQHADVAGPIVPMGIGHVKYGLVAVDEFTRFA